MSSWQSLAWGKKQQVGNPIRKLIFILLCEKADETFSCFPSSATLATEAECSRRSVVDHQHALEEVGLITIVAQRRDSGARTVNRIYLNHPDAPHMTGGRPPEPREGLEPVDNTVDRPVDNPDPPAPYAQGGCGTYTAPVQFPHPTGVRELHPLNYPREHPSDPGPDEQTDDELSTTDHQRMARDVVAATALERLEPRPSQMRRIHTVVADALRAGHSPLAVRAYLAIKAREARTVKYLLAAFEPRRLAEDLAAVTVGVPGRLRRELADARIDPTLRCPHGMDGGLHVRSDTGAAMCAQCRHEPGLVRAVT